MLPITKNAFSNKYWEKVPNYSFAANQAICAITIQELPKIQLEMPIGFIEVEDRFVLVAVLGLHNASNLFVDENNRWTRTYIPAFYRSYPFLLANTDTDVERLVLCFDEESGLLSDDETDQSFFDENGDLDSFLKTVVTLLEAMHVDRQSTIEMCAILKKHELIQPWNIEIQHDGGEHRVEGLFRIDETKFHELSDESFLELRHSGALQLIHCHLLSLPHITTLVGLAQAMSAANQSPGVEQLDFNSLGESGNINLDNL